MPTTKKALIRYLIIDRCIRSPKKYDFSMLLDAVNEQLEEEGFEGIRRTQLYKDLNDLEFSTYKAPIERVKDGRTVYFTYSDPDYSIQKQVMDEEDARHIKEALVVLSRFKGLPQFEWVNELIPRLKQSFKLTSEEREIISFDNNEFLKGLEHLGTLFHYISEKNKIEITYQPFQLEEVKINEFEPHYLKQFNNRWYLLGFNSEPSNLLIFPLDRIVELKSTKQKYTKTYPEIFSEYFEDIIGVTRYSNRACEKIILKFDVNQAPYIKTKPLHGSQKQISDNEEGLIIQLEVIPNYELETLILSFGEKVEVLEPENLRNHLLQRLQKTITAYNK